MDLVWSVLLPVYIIYMCVCIYYVYTYIYKVAHPRGTLSSISRYVNALWQIELLYRERNVLSDELKLFHREQETGFKYLRLAHICPQIKYTPTSSILLSLSGFVGVCVCVYTVHLHSSPRTVRGGNFTRVLGLCYFCVCILSSFRSECHRWFIYSALIVRCSEVYIQEIFIDIFLFLSLASAQ